VTVQQVKANLKDFQFIKYFVENEIDLDEAYVRELLSCVVEIKSDGEPDAVVDHKTRIEYHRPSSVSKLLFNLLYTGLSRYVTSPEQKDKLALGLVQVCHDYVYSDKTDYTPEGPPVLVSFDKCAVASAIIRDLVEPLVGAVKTPALFFIPCESVDVCRTVGSEVELQRDFGLPKNAVSYHDYPLTVVNCSIYNRAAMLAAITAKSLQFGLGKSKAAKLIRRLLLSKEENLLERLTQIVKILEGDPATVMDFLKFFESHIDLNVDERDRASQSQMEIIKTDSYLAGKIKTATDAYVDKQVYRQWSQWSMLMGIIEKQLAPMRGSLWPASKTMKEHDQNRQKMVAERQRAKKKSQLNFEELLEVSRDVYNHDAIEPGKLVEVLLKDERVGKT